MRNCHCSASPRQQAGCRACAGEFQARGAHNVGHDHAAAAIPLEAQRIQGVPAPRRRPAIRVRADLLLLSLVLSLGSSRTSPTFASGVRQTRVRTIAAAVTEYSAAEAGGLQGRTPRSTRPAADPGTSARTDSTKLSESIKAAATARVPDTAGAVYTTLVDGHALARQLRCAGSRFPKWSRFEGTTTSHWCPITLPQVKHRTGMIMLQRRQAPVERPAGARWP